MNCWCHLDRAESVPGEEHIVKLLGDGKCHAVLWPALINFVPSKRGNFNNQDNKSG
jgi:hypothetical protein